MRLAWGLRIAAAAVLMASCGSADDPATDVTSDIDSSVGEVVSDPAVAAPWGEGALEWFDALETAAENGLEHVAPFLASDLIWEERLSGEVIYGSDGWFDEHSRDADLVYVIPRRGQATTFVSAEAAMRQQVISFGLPKTISFLDRMEIGADGLRHWSRSGSVDAGRWYEPRSTDFDSWDALADQYVAFWNESGDADADAESLYHENAVVMDSLLGQIVSGAAGIGTSLGSGTWPAIGRIMMSELPDGGGRAVHIAPALPTEEVAPGELGLGELRLVIDADDGTGCPGSMVVALGVDDGRVRWERRYHDIGAVGRCHEPVSLRPGWWDGLAIPEPVYRQPTGTVAYGDMTIEILNGEPELAAFVEWGLQRFEDTGLTVPQVASVTFLRAHTTCYNLGGTAASSESGADIILCRTTEDICLDETCRTWPARHRQLLLHELAHGWLDEHTDKATRREFLDLIGLPRWQDSGDPWEERGVEWAAHAIAWGLMLDPVDIAPELVTTCEERVTGFRILTRTEPAMECDPNAP